MRRLRKAESLDAFIRNTSCPSMMRLPVSGVDKVPRICSNVDLPAPEAPTTDTTSPFDILRLTPLSAWRLPKDLLRFSAIIIFV